MLKPSERIREIKERVNVDYLGNSNLTEVVGVAEAIVQYLDEEWEKNKTIEQRQIDTLEQK